MKCQSCGAETKAAKYCEFCGSEMPKEKPTVNIVNNYYGNVNQMDSDSCSCPKCNSRNFKYQREKVATVSNSLSRKSSMTNTRNSNSVKQTAYRTIGLCQNCGYTYYPNESITTTTIMKKHGFWWWLLVICFWPIPLSIWFYKTDKVNLEKKRKLAIITGFWVLMLIVSALSPEPETQTNETSNSMESTTVNKEMDNNIDRNEGDMDVKLSNSNTESTKEEVKEISFNEEFINAYLPMGVPKIIEEYKKIYDAGDFDVTKSLLYRNHQKDTSIPVLEEQIVSGEGLVISISTYAGELGTTSADLYLGDYDFDYKMGIIPATEKLLEEHPEEWNKFISIQSSEYMKINKGDKVYFEGRIYGIQNDSMHIRGTCEVK